MATKYGENKMKSEISREGKYTQRSTREERRGDNREEHRAEHRADFT
jgi:hypothetical protein